MKLRRTKIVPFLGHPVHVKMGRCDNFKTDTISIRYFAIQTSFETSWQDEVSSYYSDYDNALKIAFRFRPIRSQLLPKPVSKLTGNTRKTVLYILHLFRPKIQFFSNLKKHFRHFKIFRYHWR